MGDSDAHPPYIADVRSSRCRVPGSLGRGKYPDVYYFEPS